MFKDLKGVVNGKTVWGVVLALFSAVALTFADIGALIPFVPPEIVKTILLGAPAFLTAFGLWDSTQDDFNDIKKALKKFVASSPALGIGLNIVVQLIDKAPTLGVPDWAETVAVIVGGFLVTFGLKGQAVGARANLAPVPIAAKEKYKTAN